MTGLTRILSHSAIWRGDELARVTTPSLATGFPMLDAELPGGGWPMTGLTEIIPEHEGIGELRIFASALAHLSAQGRRLAWIAPPYLPYAPALQAAGIDLAQILFIRTRSLRETLWATEQALRSRACAAVLAWIAKPTYSQLRRLQLAAEIHASLALMFRPLNATLDATPAVLRLSLHCIKGELAIHILKRRGSALGRPIRLRPSSVINRKLPVPNHVVDRNRFPLPATRIVSADLSTA